MKKQKTTKQTKNINDLKLTIFTEDFIINENIIAKRTI